MRVSIRCLLQYPAYADSALEYLNTVLSLKKAFDPKLHPLDWYYVARSFFRDILNLLVVSLASSGVVSIYKEMRRFFEEIS